MYMYMYTAQVHVQLHLCMYTVHVHCTCTSIKNIVNLDHEHMYTCMALHVYVFRVSFMGGWGHSPAPCYSFASPWNLFSNMHTMTTLYVGPLKVFQIHVSPPLDKFSK